MHSIKKLLTHPDTATEQQIAGYYAAPFDSEELYLRSLAKYRGEAAPPKRKAGISVRPGFQAMSAAACLLVTLGLVGGVWLKHQRINPVPPEEPAAPHPVPETEAPGSSAASAVPTGTETAPVVVIPGTMPQTEPQTEGASRPAATDPTEPPQTEPAMQPTQPIKTTEPSKEGTAADPTEALQTEPAAATEPATSSPEQPVPETEPEPTDPAAQDSRPTDFVGGDPMPTDPSVQEPPIISHGFRIDTVVAGSWEMTHLYWLGEVPNSPEGYIRYSSIYSAVTTEVIDACDWRMADEDAVYRLQTPWGEYILCQHRRTHYEIYLKTPSYEISTSGDVNDAPNVTAIGDREYLFWDDGSYTFSLSREAGTGFAAVDPIYYLQYSLGPDPDGERVK